MAITARCGCEVDVEAASEDTFPDAYLVHVRTAHPDWEFSDLAIRIVGEALLRLTGSKDRLEHIGSVIVEPVMPDHLDDWLSFFDHDAFTDRPWVASCYCFEQHAPLLEPGLGVWKEQRAAMVGLFETGAAYGYLAFVDGRPAGWVNAALREAQVYALGNDADRTTITVSCFNMAPPYRAHGLSAELLDRVIADAPARGATRIEAHPQADNPSQFRGTASLYESRGFEVVKDLGWSTLVRLDLSL
jgi:GNAT superfamily N-acetyltransferase